jgi:hypothetical protein
MPTWRKKGRFSFFDKKVALFTAIAIIASGSIGILFLWHAWPRSHLLIYEQALNDVHNLRKNPDGTYENQYRGDLSKYGAFGDIYGSLTSLFASLAFIATGSALLIQIYLFYDQKSHQIKFDKQQKTFAFYEDFNNSEMFKVRIEADLYLRSNRNNFYEIAESYTYDPGDRGKGAGSIWPIMRFYQKLAKAVEYDQLNDDMTIDLFGEVFIWWYIAYFDDKLIKVSLDKAWDAADDLKKLQKWLEDECNNCDDVKKYNRWKEAANDYKEKNFQRMQQA